MEVYEERDALTAALAQSHQLTVGVELSGVGSPEGAVVALPGSYYTDTAGTNGAWRWLKKTGSGVTGWFVESGDTGQRTVSASLLAANGYTGGFLVINRTGDLVSWTAQGVTRASGGAGYQRVYDIPAGFRPCSLMTTYFRTLTGVAFGYISGAEVTINTPGVNESFSATWATADAWPTTLPGT